MKLTVICGAFVILLLNQVDARNIYDELKEKLEVLSNLERAAEDGGYYAEDESVEWIEENEVAKRGMIDEKDIEAMKRAGVKFSLYDIFWTIDSVEAGITGVLSDIASTNQVHNSKVVFLEEGTTSAGLIHIWKRHAKEFQSLWGVKDDEALAVRLRSTMVDEKCQYTLKVGSRGTETTLYYPTDKSKYLMLTFGSNGFVVTSYPTSKPPTTARNCY